MACVADIYDLLSPQMQVLPRDQDASQQAARQTNRIRRSYGGKYFLPPPRSSLLWLANKMNGAETQKTLWALRTFPARAQIEL